MSAHIVAGAPEPVRFGVIGLGAMGRNHVRVVAEMSGLQLVAVADPSIEAREQVAKARRVPAYARYEDMLTAENLHAVIVAVPTSFHEEVAVTAMEAGCHVLVEKPLASSVEGAERVVAAAAAAGVVATVGHIERYNPAVTKLRAFLDEGALGHIHQIRATRTGPLPERIQDVGVVVDLATHELDVIRYLVGSTVESVHAECAQRIHSVHEDLATGLLRFANGTIALLDVNWLTPVKIRELSVVGAGGMYTLDYVGQNLLFHENSHTSYWPAMAGRQGVSEGNMIQYQIDRAEPLRLELASFADAIRGVANGLVPLSDGVAAIALAETMLQSSKIHSTISGDDLPAVLTNVGVKG